MDDNHRLNIISADQISVSKMLDLYRQCYGKAASGWPLQINLRYGPGASTESRVVQLTDTNSGLVGVATVFASYRRVGGQTLKTAQLADLMVHPKHRSMAALTAIYGALEETLKCDGFDIAYTVPNQKSVVLNRRFLKLEIKKQLFARLLPTLFCYAGHKVMPVDTVTDAPAKPAMHLPCDHVVQTDGAQARVFVRKFWNGFPFVIKAGNFDLSRGADVQPDFMDHLSRERARLIGIGVEYVRDEPTEGLLGRLAKQRSLKIQGKALTERGEAFDYGSLQPIDFDFFWY